MRPNRRQLVKATGAAAAAIAASCTQTKTTRPTTAETRARLTYPEQGIASLNNLKPGVAVSFAYPDPDSPCLLLAFDHSVPGGAGTQQNIVAFSQLCSHMGCPVTFEPATSRLKCPCHFTMFDPERLGQIICGQATTALPRIVLRIAEDGEIFAIGVEGLIYGRQANLLT